jgi:uridylate kinase
VSCRGSTVPSGLRNLYSFSCCAAAVSGKTPASITKDNKIPIIVFNLTVEGNILKAVMGENIGTYVGRL